MLSVTSRGLSSQHQEMDRSAGSEYVYPALADMYQRDPSKLSYRVTKLLQSLGFKKAVLPEGRSRHVSVLDVHSLRHGFAYFAGKYDVKFVVVQGVLGHMTAKMTELYSAHANRADIADEMGKLAQRFGDVDATEAAELPSA